MYRVEIQYKARLMAPESIEALKDLYAMEVEVNNYFLGYNYDGRPSYYWAILTDAESIMFKLKYPKVKMSPLTQDDIDYYYETHPDKL